MGNGDVRQMRNQANQISNDIQDLRRQMQSAGADQQDLRALEDVLNGLRALGSTADPKSIEGLTARALEKMQTVEYDLRKKVDQTNQQLYIAGSQEVAPQFKKPVQDYFRELSKRTGSAQPAPQTAPATPTKGKGK